MLLVLEVLVDGGVEVLGVALVQTVDLPLLLDLHVPLSQDELADGLTKSSVMFVSWVILTRASHKTE